MDGALTTQDGQAMAVQHWESPRVLAQRIQRMHEIQQTVMKPDVDFGRVPGCDKPTLLKPGAELLKVTFRLADRVQVEDLCAEGKIHYRVKTELYSQETGAYLGCGFGECSSLEEKYHWRRAVCDEEWEEAEPAQRRTKYGKKRSGDVYKVAQIQTNPADVGNTVLKMAKKRSSTDAVLNVLAASRIFNQDMEDLSPELLEIAAGKQSTKPPINQQPTARGPAPARQGGPSEQERKANRWISPKQEGLLTAKAKKNGVSIDSLKGALKKEYGYDHLYQITWQGGQFNAILKRVETDPESFAKYGQAEDAEYTDAAAESAEPETVSWVKALRATAREAGYTTEESLNSVLLAEFSVDSPEKVTPQDQGTVLDYFQALVDENSTQG